MVYTKVFISGNSQAVRIPKEYHINESELAIKKIGTTIILFPKSSPWAHLEQGVAEFTPDYMADGRNQPDRNETGRRAQGVLRPGVQLNGPHTISKIDSIWNPLPNKPAA